MNIFNGQAKSNDPRPRITVSQRMHLAHLLKSIRRNLGVLLAGTGVAMGLTLVTTMINARALGVEGLGVITLVQAYIALLSGICSFSSQQPTIRLGTQAIHDKNPAMLGNVFGLGIVFDTAGGVLAGILSLAFLPLLISSDPYLENYTPEITVFCLTGFLSGIATMNGVFRLYGRFHYISLAQIMQAGLNLAGSCVLWLRDAPLGQYLLLFAAAQAAFYAVQLALGLVTIHRNGTRVVFKGFWRSAARRSFVDYIWTTWSSSTIDTGRRRIDTLLLAFVTDPATVGIYGVARQLTSLLNRLKTAVTAAVFPEVSLLAATGNTSVARSLVRRFALGGIALGGSLVAATVAFGHLVLVEGFGAQFASGYAALVLLTVAATVMLSVAALSGPVQAFVSPRKLLQINSLAAIPFLMCCVFLIDPLGMTGAALAQVSYACTVWVLCWIALRQRLGGPTADDAPDGANAITIEEP